MLGSERLDAFPWLDAEVPLVALVDKAIGLSWTRDPFDRLLAAHSEARRIPLCSLDRRVLDRHRFLPDELRA